MSCLTGGALSLQLLLESADKEDGPSKAFTKNR